jgi:hypothetical protein
VTNDRRSPVVFPASSRLTSSSPDAALIQAICHQLHYSVICLNGVKHTGTRLKRDRTLIVIGRQPRQQAVEPQASCKCQVRQPMTLA